MSTPAMSLHASHMVQYVVMLGLESNYPHWSSHYKGDSSQLQVAMTCFCSTGRAFEDASELQTHHLDSAATEQTLSVIQRSNILITIKCANMPLEKE